MNAQLTEIMRLITNLIRTGVVTEVDRENWLCRVKTGDLETNWISWLTLRAGNARTWWRPSEGEQVVLLSLGGNLEPDMVSFSGVRDFYGKQLLPGGLILQWLTIPSSAAVKAVTLDNGNYQLSGYKWPQSFGVLFAVFATKVSGSTNEAYAISVNRHSTDVIVTWNARKADDVHILVIGKL
ncbi:phage baseplate assembly protein V [Escherichia coli]|nr:phage baseplate assembly protein V [Escherichia coli]